MLSQNCIARSKATSLPRQSKTSIAYVILCVLEVIGALSNYPEKKNAGFNYLITGEEQGDCPLRDVGLPCSEDDTRKRYQENEALRVC